MRHPYRILFLLLILSSTISAQDCPSGTLTFTNQSQIDNFITTYPNCTRINQEILIEEETSGAITNLLGLQNLRFIETLNIRDNNSLRTLKGLDSLEMIGFVCAIVRNQSLETLEGLDNLQAINGLCSIFGNENLVSLKGLTNLNYIENDINITNNPKLKNLTGLDGLRKINRGFIAIQNNSSMTSLVGISKLTEINLIIIEDNENLSNLKGLGNVDMTLDMLEINNNPKLSLCSEPSICRYITSGGLTSFSGNASGCNTPDEILISCEGLSKVNYHIFSDFNKNKIQDADEPLFPGAGVQVLPAANLYFPNPEQPSLFYLDAGDYTISFANSAAPNWQLTTDSASYTLSLDSTFNCDTLSFGIAPKTDIVSMSANIDAPPARCNEIISFSFHTKNLGTVLVEGTLWFEVDESIDSIIFIQQPDTFISPNRYGWHFDTLYPGYSYSQQIQLKIPGPPDFPLGDLLHFVSFADFVSSYGADRSHTFHYDTEVRCSYDPNDKLVSPRRANQFTLFEEDLYYTVRFQNTGNDVAYDVLILDTLDANLDPNSFRLLSTSHPEQLQTTLEEGRYLSFSYENIFLPDSSTNLEGSQGYVSFLISPKDGLAENTNISNTASIYFDFNPPIVTNTTQNILVSELVSLQEVEQPLPVRIFPNPTRQRLFIQSDSDAVVFLRLTDQLGRLLVQREIQGTGEIDLSAFGSGVYFLHLQIGDQQVTRKIIKT